MTAAICSPDFDFSCGVGVCACDKCRDVGCYVSFVLPTVDAVCFAGVICCTAVILLCGAVRCCSVFVVVPFFSGGFFFRIHCVVRPPLDRFCEN